MNPLTFMLARLGFDPCGQNTWIRPDGILLRRITSSAWRLSVEGKEGCTMITSLRRRDEDRAEELASLLRTEVEQIVESTDTLAQQETEIHDSAE